MNLDTTYLGLALPHPFICGASPLVDDLDNVRRLEDAGAAAIVMNSLFEEQITQDAMATWFVDELVDEPAPETLAFFPASSALGRGPDEYLEHLQRVKRAVAVPVIFTYAPRSSVDGRYQMRRSARTFTESTGIDFWIEKPRLAVNPLGTMITSE